MVKTIYVDILFIINFIINYLILYAVAGICALRHSKARLLASSAFGAAYGVFSFFPQFPFLLLTVSKLSFSALIVFSAFGKDRFLRNCFSFLLVSFVFGGAVFASGLAFNSPVETQNGILYIHISLPMLFSVSLLIYGLLALIFKRCAAKREGRLYRVSVKDGEKRLTLIALLDTGNSLRDPSSNARVVISDLDSISEILPRDAFKILASANADAYPLKLPEVSRFGSFKLIPYKTVGVSFALLLCFCPDEILFDGQKQKGALLAISPCKVSDGGAYSALI